MHTHIHTQRCMHSFCDHAEVAVNRESQKRQNSLFEIDDYLKRRCTAVDLQNHCHLSPLRTRQCFFLNLLPFCLLFLCAKDAVHSSWGALKAPLLKAAEENACAAPVVWPLVFSIWSQHSELACCLSEQTRAVKCKHTNRIFHSHI